MRQNLYHILHALPATEAWEMPPTLEALARSLVQSGRLRINADTVRNFVRVGTVDTDATVTARELTDPALLPRTRAKLARYVPGAEGDAGVEALLSRLRGELKKTGGVSLEKELKIARVLVQSAEPVVIQHLLISGTEVYVSYAHNVGDLLAVHQWQNEGMASGLQATDSRRTAVYVSAGGDPFFEGEHKTYTTDGFPALSRMMVIAGQELGHFADLKRTPGGDILGRHTTDNTARGLRASPIASAARTADIAHVARLMQQYRALGLPALRHAEHSVAFYHKRLRFSPPWWWHQARRLVVWSIFHARLHPAGLWLRLSTTPRHRYGEALELFLGDMAFNLAPEADAYRDPNPVIEEAIAVIEALARVPQQVLKWGHGPVKAAWPQLYAFYYGTVIPTNQAAIANPILAIKKDKIQIFISFLRRRTRAKPGYYP